MGTWWRFKMKDPFTWEWTVEGEIEMLRMKCANWGESWGMIYYRDLMNMGNYLTGFHNPADTDCYSWFYMHCLLPLELLFLLCVRCLTCSAPHRLLQRIWRQVWGAKGPPRQVSSWLGPHREGGEAWQPARWGKALSDQNRLHIMLSGFYRFIWSLFSCFQEAVNKRDIYIP